MHIICNLKECLVSQKAFARLLINNYLIYYEGYHCLFHKSHKPCLHSYLQLGITVKWRLDYDENENMAKTTSLHTPPSDIEGTLFPRPIIIPDFKMKLRNSILEAWERKKLFRTSVWYGRRPFAQTHHHPWAHECLKKNKKMSWKIKFYFLLKSKK